MCDVSFLTFKPGIYIVIFGQTLMSTNAGDMTEENTQREPFYAFWTKKKLN